MGIIALITSTLAFIFLVMNSKARSNAAYLEMQLKARQKDIAASEVENEELRATLKQRLTELHNARQDLAQRTHELQRFQSIIDVEAEASRLLVQSKAERERLVHLAQVRVNQAEARLLKAGEDADKILAAANIHAQEIAGDALKAMGKAKQYADAAQAMKNIINGYGDDYIVPTYHLLDDLAEEFGFTEAGQKLKEARDHTKLLVKSGRAASCDYSEPTRRETANRFVTDAFNGKVDSILSRSKSDNYGKLEQEIRDAAAIVNQLGASFRSARINNEYLKSRLEELRWAVVTKLLKDEEREEQRRLREQMREEEKARREFERAIKEANKEETLLRKALDKAHEQIAAASAAEREVFQTRLALLQGQLQAAEEKNKRALSMAQQTRAGHVYVISNIGSFGEEVFKIGMTRRLEPLDRVRELGDASVPFEFDVHAMVFSDDAPGLEKQLHRAFLREQVNKVNPRKEFFRVDLPLVRRTFETLGFEAQWTMTADAKQYRETRRIEDQIRENPVVAAEWTRHQLELEEAIAEEEIIESVTWHSSLRN